jgi:hypothetical protein
MAANVIVFVVGLFIGLTAKRSRTTDKSENIYKCTNEGCCLHHIDTCAESTWSCVDMPTEDEHSAEDAAEPKTHTHNSGIYVI